MTSRRASVTDDSRYLYVSAETTAFAFAKAVCRRGWIFGSIDPARRELSGDGSDFWLCLANLCFGEDEMVVIVVVAVCGRRCCCVKTLLLMACCDD